MNHSDGKLANRAAIVTGAAGDMGMAVGQRLLAAGASVLLADIDAAGAEAAAARMEANPERVLSFRADATLEQDANAMVSAALDRFGSVDVLVNNAGLLRPTRI